MLPDVVFHMRVRDESVEGENPYRWDLKTTRELFGGKRVLIFGLPGAFTPTCSNNQLPTFEKMAQEFYNKGIDEIWCTSVNDAFVMHQWGLSQNLKEVKLLPDGSGHFARGLDMLVEKDNLGFGLRSWRYALIADDLKIEVFSEEEVPMHNCPTDPYEKSKPEHVITLL